MYHLEIDLEHLKNDREQLHDAIMKQPAFCLELMENGARQFLLKSKQDLDVVEADVPPVQITFTGQLPATHIRNITVRGIRLNPHRPARPHPPPPTHRLRR